MQVLQALFKSYFTGEKLGAALYNLFESSGSADARTI
jgi:hypothetical protein